MRLGDALTVEGVVFLAYDRLTVVGVDGANARHMTVLIDEEQAEIVDLEPSGAIHSGAVGEGAALLVDAIGAETDGGCAVGLHVEVERLSQV